MSNVSDGYNWFTLFVKTGREQMVMLEIERIWEIGGLEPFTPTRDVFFRRRGKVVKERERLFPGYVFIKSDIEEREFAARAREFIFQSEHTLRLLQNGSDSDCSFAMSAPEKKMLERLLNKEYCVEMSKGIIEGDKVVVTEGSLVGLESIIRHVDRHRLTALIEVEIMGDKRPITVGLEVVSKV